LFGIGASAIAVVALDIFKRWFIVSIFNAVPPPSMLHFVQALDLHLTFNSQVPEVPEWEKYQLGSYQGPAQDGTGAEHAAGQHADVRTAHELAHQTAVDCAPQAACPVDSYGLQWVIGLVHRDHAEVHARGLQPL